MRYTGGTEELYDMVKAPKQFTNPQYSPVLKQMQEKLDARIKAAGLDQKKKKGGKKK